MQTLKMYTKFKYNDPVIFKYQKDYTAIFYRATHLRKLKYKVKFYMKVECPIKMTKVVSHHSKHTENEHTCKQLLLQNPCSGHY